MKRTAVMIAVALVCCTKREAPKEINAPPPAPSTASAPRTSTAVATQTTATTPPRVPRRLPPWLSKTSTDDSCRTWSTVRIAKGTVFACGIPVHVYKSDAEAKESAGDIFVCCTQVRASAGKPDCDGTKDIDCDGVPNAQDDYPFDPNRPPL